MKTSHPTNFAHLHTGRAQLLQNIVPRALAELFLGRGHHGGSDQGHFTFAIHFTIVFSSYSASVFAYWLAACKVLAVHLELES